MRILYWTQFCNIFEGYCILLKRSFKIESCSKKLLVGDIISFCYDHPLNDVLICLISGEPCLDLFGWCVSRGWCVYWKREVHYALFKILRLLPRLALRAHCHCLPQLQSRNCFRRLDENSSMILKVLNSSYIALQMENRLASSRLHM